MTPQRVGQLLLPLQCLASLLESCGNDHARCNPGDIGTVMTELLAVLEDQLKDEQIPEK